MKIDLDLNSAEVDQFLDIIDFLNSNNETIIKDITPNVASFLKNESLFQGGFKIKYNKEFEKFILNELKVVVLDHFPLDPETINILMDRDMLKLVGVLDTYLEKENYNGNTN